MGLEITSPNEALLPDLLARQFTPIEHGRNQGFRVVKHSGDISNAQEFIKIRRWRDSLRERLPLRCHKLSLEDFGERGFQLGEGRHQPA